MGAPVPTKYAHLEDEQRFVVDAVPPGATHPVTIEDRYLTGTRLRLRRVVDGTTTTYKLGHKVPVDPQRCSAVLHTTCYLDAAEFELLRGLPGHALRKRRWKLGNLAADEFDGDLTGLVLVEGPRPVAQAPDGAVEVTEDARFCGGSLAALGAAAARQLVEAARGLRR